MQSRTQDESTHWTYRNEITAKDFRDEISCPSMAQDSDGDDRCYTAAGIFFMGLAEDVGIGCATAVGMAVQKNVRMHIKPIKMKVQETRGHCTMNVCPDTGAEVDRRTPVEEIHQHSGGFSTEFSQPLTIEPETTVYQITGPVNFLSMFEIDGLAEDIEERNNVNDPVVLDLRYVTSIDFTAVEELVGRVIEAADGAPVRTVTCRGDIHRTMDIVDKNQVVARYSSMELSQ